MAEELRFRPNVGLMIVNSKGQVWLGKRYSLKGKQKNYSEQMPQGGIDKGEEPIQAAYRELAEETGLTKENVRLLKISQDWYSYTFPKPKYWGDEMFNGQRQKWFLFLHTGKETDFNLEAHPEEIEFSSYQWCPVNEVAERVIPFKRSVYERVIQEFQPIINQLTAQNPS